MEKQSFVNLFIILSLLILNKECAGSTLKEPMSSAQNGSISEAGDIGNGGNAHNKGNDNFSCHTTLQISRNEKDDNVKKIAQIEDKIEEVMGTTKKIQETQDKKYEELVNSTKHLQTDLDKVVKILSDSVSKQANDVKHPAFTGSSYVAIAAPEWIHNFTMSMDVKATEPVTDGIIMYCAEKESYGGFMSLAVRQGRLEFRFNNDLNSKTIVLTADRTLPANEWTNIEVSRQYRVVSLRINSGAALEGSLEHLYNLLPATPIFIGGVDASTDPKNNTAVSGGFKGCIKHVTLLGDRKDNLLKGVLRSANVQECRNDKWEIF